MLLPVKMYNRPEPASGPNIDMGSEESIRVLNLGGLIYDVASSPMSTRRNAEAFLRECSGVASSLLDVHPDQEGTCPALHLLRRRRRLRH